MAKGRALVALSGGVDSSVCAVLLRRQGYEVEGAVLDLSPCHESAVEAAQVAARQLSIPLHIISAREYFDRQVIQPFAKSYYQGETPNPCIFCNPQVKFALIRQKALELGFDKMATGHYAGIFQREGKAYLTKAGCLPRDQSYMLYRLTQEQLSMLLLPLSSLTKDQVREIAREENLSCAQSPDSQEICFVPGNDYAAFLEERFGPSKTGYFISPQGEPVAKHRGILHYTTGQRKGLGIALGRPVFVRQIDPDSGNIYLGDAGEEYAGAIRLRDVLLQPDRETLLGEDVSFRAQVKVRSRATPSPALVTLTPGATATVRFDAPERAPAPGQSCVFYRDGLVLGGGVITRQLPAES